MSFSIITIKYVYNNYLAFSDRNDDLVEIRVKENLELDYDDGRITNSCVIVAYDKSPNPLSASVTLNIELLDVNDNTPIVHGTPITGNISRYEKPGKVVISEINVTDDDSGVNQEITFTLGIYMKTNLRK